MTRTYPTRCHDCHVDTLPTNPGRLAEYYMVRDEVWQDATAAGVLPGFDPPRIDFLCVGCIEARLGRRLVAADFTDAVLNRPQLDVGFARFAWWWRSPRLQDRLTSV